MKTESEVVTYDSNPTLFEPGERARRGRRRRRRTRAIAIILGTALAAGGAWAGTRLLDGEPETATGPRFAGAGDGQTAYLFMIRRPEDATRRSDMLVVFAIDDDGRNPVTLFVPSNALTEIPGHGLDLAGRGFSFGGMPLQSLVVDNILGITLDRDAAFTDEVLGKIVDLAGGIEITVDGTLYSGAADGSLVAEFQPGLQLMDGETVRRYLRYQGSDETELSRIARAQQVWESLIVKWGKLGPGVLAQQFRSLGTEWNRGIETGLSPLDLAEFFIAFATAPEERIYTSLPVDPVSAGGAEQALKLDEERIAELVREYFAGSVPQNPYLGTRIQVLNGNGIPQIGEDVALKLIPKGFRIVLNRNANSFDHQETKIIVYSRDERAVGAARMIQELLGVGTIEIGRRTQSVVDVTVLVGHDFQPRN